MLWSFKQSPVDASMLNEHQVIEYLCKFLKDKRYKIKKLSTPTEHGVDILAEAPDGKKMLYVEAKGATSSKRGTRRFGHPDGFDSSQWADHIAKAFSNAVNT